MWDSPVYFSGAQSWDIPAYLLLLLSFLPLTVFVSAGLWLCKCSICIPSMFLQFVCNFLFITLLIQPSHPTYISCFIFILSSLVNELKSSTRTGFLFCKNK